MKKFLSLILTLAMVLSLVTVPAMAEAGTLGDPITDTTSTVSITGLTNGTYVGQTVTATAALTGQPAGATLVSYTWSFTEGGTIETVSQKTGASIALTGKAAGTVSNITCTAIYSTTAAETTTYYKVTSAATSLNVQDNSITATPAANTVAVAVGSHVEVALTVDKTKLPTGSVVTYGDITSADSTKATATVANDKVTISGLAATDSGVLLTIPVTAKKGDVTVASDNATITVNVVDTTGYTVLDDAHACTSSAKHYMKPNDNTVTLAAKLMTAATGGTAVTGATVTYTSSNTAVLTVNSTTGAVTAVKAGDAIVTATTTYGGKSFNSLTYYFHVADLSYSLGSKLGGETYTNTLTALETAINNKLKTELGLSTAPSCTISIVNTPVKQNGGALDSGFTADKTTTSGSLTVKTARVLADTVIKVPVTLSDGSSFDLLLTVKAPTALSATFGTVENGKPVTLSTSALKSALISAIKTAENVTVTADQITSLKVTALPSHGTLTATPTSGTASNVTANSTMTLASYSGFTFAANKAYIGSDEIAIEVVANGVTYVGKLNLTVTSYGSIDKTVSGTVSSSGSTVSFDSGYSYLFYYIGSSSNPSFNGNWSGSSAGATGWSSRYSGSSVSVSSSSTGSQTLNVVGIDSSGYAYTGTITVTQDVIEYTGIVSEDIVFVHEDFTDYLDDVTYVSTRYPYATFDYVTFSNPTNGGQLYYDGAKATSSTKIYDVGKVKFVPTNFTNVASKTITLNFSIHADYYTSSSTTATQAANNAKNYSGVVVISLYKASDIKYEVDANKTVTFNEKDFNKFFTKADLSYVEFGKPSSGTLYETSTCKTEAKTSTKFYYDATKSQDDLDTVTFKADKTPLTEYSVYIPFKAYAKKNGTKSSDGVVEIIVNGSMPFTDVPESNTFYEYIKYCYRENIMQGKSTTLFKPTEPVTRAQLVVTLYRMANSPTTYNSNTMSFTDCKTLSTEFQNAIKWGVAKKLINGYGNTFKPNDSITRQAMVTILYRFGTNLGYIDGYGVTGSLNRFSDAAKISASMKDAVAWAVGAGLVSGNNGKFNPAGTTTRGACAKILAGFHETYVG